MNIKEGFRVVAKILQHKAISFYTYSMEEEKLSRIVRGREGVPKTKGRAEKRTTLEQAEVITIIRTEKKEF